MKAIVDERLDAGAVRWQAQTLTISRDLLGRSPSGVEDLALSFLSISALGLSSLILQAMSPEYASFIDQLFAGDKRRRGVWSRELAGKIGAVEIVSPF